MPTNEYVAIYNGGYYLAGTRIGLCAVTYDFRNGLTAEQIFARYPLAKSLAKVYGAIAFILEHPDEVESYLRDRDRVHDELKVQFPMPAELTERIEQAERESAAKVA